MAATGGWQAAEGTAGLRPWLDKGVAFLCLSRLVGAADARVAALKTAVDGVGPLPYELVEWYSPAPEAAVAVGLGTPAGDGVALIAVNQGKLLDTLPAPANDDVDTQKAAQFAAQFGQYIAPGKAAPAAAAGAAMGGQVRIVPAAGRRAQQQNANAVASVAPGGETMKIDVAKMMTQGQDLLRKGHAVYATKFFLKALGVLDAVRDERLEQSEPADENLDGSVAEALAWAVIGHTVLGEAAEAHAAAERLRGTKVLAVFAEEPLSTPAQAVALDAITQAAGMAYKGDDCSVKKLEPLLRADPKDLDTRAKLLVTLFLSGDAERALTEALKLRGLKHRAGDAAFDGLCKFLGAKHPLVVALHAPAAAAAQQKAAE